MFVIVESDLGGFQDRRRLHISTIALQRRHLHLRLLSSHDGCQGRNSILFMAERIDIERALDKIVSEEAGFKFQSLAVVLAKLRWPELLACERHNDLGLDAYASVSFSSDGRGKGVACSTTGTLDKLKGDAEKVQKHYPDVSLLVFYTTQKVTQSTKAKWAQKIREKYGYELIVASREEIIASLRLPDNAPLCRTHLEIPVPYEPTVADLLKQAREATAAAAADWAAHPRLAGKPRIILNAVVLGKNGADGTEISNTASLRGQQVGFRSGS